MKRLATVLAVGMLLPACIATTPGKGSIATVLVSERRMVEDPEAVADLQTFWDAKALHQGNFTAPMQVAQCIVDVVREAPTAPDAIYEDVLRCDEDCHMAVFYGAMPVLAQKYAKRCAALPQTRAVVFATRDLSEDLETVRILRGQDSPDLGVELANLDARVELLKGIGVPLEVVQRAHDEIAALRLGVYGTRAMKSVIDDDPTVRRLRAELAPLTAELETLHRAASHRPADDARAVELRGRADDLTAHLAAATAKYGLAAATAREASYAADPAVAPAVARRKIVHAELESIQRQTAPTASDRARQSRLASEQDALDASLAAARARAGVTWPL